MSNFIHSLQLSDKSSRECWNRLSCC